MDNKLSANARRLLRTLVTNGPAYRADLARSLRVSRATITNLVNSLYADGWLAEPDYDPNSLKNLIGTSKLFGTLASVTFLVNRCAITLSTLDGRVLRELTLNIDPGLSAQDRIHTGAEALGDLLEVEGVSPSSLRAIHLAVDTQMDAQSGAIFAQRASSRWFGINPKEYFYSWFDVPIYIQNTARLEALAEFLAHSQELPSNMLHIDASYGVTAGHVIDGVIQSGSRGGSGELGHTIYDWNGPLCTCGNTGCLMQYVSIPAFLREYSVASGEEIDWPEFLELATANESTVSRIVERASVILARSLVNVCHTIDPGMVVISGEIGRNISGFAEKAGDLIREHALPLVGRELTITKGTLMGDLAQTSRAGIYSLRTIEEVIDAAAVA